MMKKYLIFSILLFSFVQYVKSQTPNWHWTKSFSSISYSNCYSVTTDANGNIYTTGYFEGTIDFDPDSINAYNLTAIGNDDIFISKLDSSGNFVWAKSIGGSGYDYSSSLIVAANGDIYTTGYFYGTVDFNPDSIGVFNIVATGGNDIFILKLNSSGNFIWAKSVGGASDDYSSALTIDREGSGGIYISGSFHDTVDFDPDSSGIFNLTSTGILDIFVLSLDSSGNFIWAKRIGGTGHNWCTSLAIDPLGSSDLYMTGYFRESSDFDPGFGVYNLISKGGFDIFISNLDAMGNFIWAREIGGIADDKANSLTLAEDNSNIFFTGYFTGMVDFDPDSLGIYNLVSDSGIGNIFIAKFNNSGNFSWAKAVTGTGYSEGRTITLDTSNNIFVSGAYSLTADFDPNIDTTNLTSVGSADIFILKLDNSGNFGWVKAVGGESNDAAMCISIDSSCNVYLTGYFFSSTIPFGSNTLTNADSSGNTQDIFIAKLNDRITGIERMENKNLILIFPNPTSSSFSIIIDTQLQNDQVEICNLLGENIYSSPKSVIKNQKSEMRVDVSAWVPGIYFVKVLTEKGATARKLVVE